MFFIMWKRFDKCFIKPIGIIIPTTTDMDFTTIPYNLFLNDLLQLFSWPLNFRNYWNLKNTMLTSWHHGKFNLNVMSWEVKIFFVEPNITLTWFVAWVFLSAISLTANAAGIKMLVSIKAVWRVDNTVKSTPDYTLRTLYSFWRV
jgi:hypothetical protein